MSGIQRFFKAIVSKSTFQKMEAESRSWILKCPNCNYETSVWERGGIRYKAAGTPKRLMVCSNCGQKNWHLIYKKTP